TLLHPADTELIEGDGYFEGSDFITSVSERPVTVEQIVSVTFYETWLYDSIGGTLVKLVHGMIPHILETDQQTGELRAKPLFYIPFSSASLSGDAVATLTGFTYDMRTDDSLFDVSLPGSTMAFVNSADRAKEDAGLGKIISGATGSKKTSFFKPVYPYGVPFGKKELKTLRPLLPASNALRFYEDWVFDAKRMVFMKMVHGVVLLQKKNAHMAEYDPSPVTAHAFVSLNGFVPSPFAFPPLARVGRVEYASLFRNRPDFPDADFMLHPDSAAMTAMANSIWTSARTGKTPVYDQRNTYGTFIESVDGSFLAPPDSIFFVREEMVIIDSMGNETWQDVSVALDSTLFSGFRFAESWTYDAAHRTLGKTIYSLSAMYVKTDYETDTPLGFYPLFTVYPADTVKDPSTLMKPEFLVARNILSPVRINMNMANASPEYSTDYQVPCAVYSDDPTCDIAPSSRYLFVQQIFNDVMAGKIAAYDSLGNMLSVQQLKTKVDALKDSTYAPGDLPSEYMLFDELIFAEDWYFNPATSQLYKKVTAVTFTGKNPDASDGTGAAGRRTSVFTVKMN
ncbi:MAG TPA: hypothetical protein VFU15_15565, partial [Bacteroidia bacterium]|nr:hypothetical protein [Bacteroidia bacterium]